MTDLFTFVPFQYRLEMYPIECENVIVNSFSKSRHSKERRCQN